VADVTEDSIIDIIDAAALKTAFVIVDLEGTASMMVGYAMSRADLVIIPVQGSHLDAAEAAKAIKLVRAQERVFKRTIRYTILFTRTSATTRTRTFQSIEAEFYENKSEGRIRISKRWATGADGETKTEASDGYVPLHPLLAEHLKDWHRQSPYAKDKDFVFPSLMADGKVPLSSCSFVKDHLRPAAKAVGVAIADGQRFGLHNLRHSLSNWLVNKGKVEPKTVQGLLRHSKIQTTLDLYTQEDCDETRAAQGSFLSAMGMHSGMVQEGVGWIVGCHFGSHTKLSSLLCMAGTTGLEPATSAVTGQHSNQLNYVPNGSRHSTPKAIIGGGLCIFRTKN
jgi:hypothetical protein